MKLYTIEMWDEIIADCKSGCDELLGFIKEEIQNYFPESVKMRKFEDK